MNLLRFLPGYTRRLIEGELKNGSCFDELKFPLESLRKYRVIQFRSSHTKEYAGLAVSQNVKDAYKIAYFEYLERKALFEFGVSKGFESTNGIALHKFQLMAAEAARSEIYERDSFLLHWYSQTPLLPINIVDVPSLDLHSVFKELLILGYKVQFGMTYLGEQQTLIAFLIDVKTEGFAIGLSSGRGYVKDLEKAFLESCVNLFFGHCGRDKEDLLNEVRSNGICSLSGHRSYWLYMESMPDWIFEKVSTKNNTYVKTPIKLQEVLITDTPFPVIGMLSKDLITLEVGPPSGTAIDLLRRRIRVGNKLDINMWNYPHPIP